MWCFSKLTRTRWRRRNVVERMVQTEPTTENLEGIVEELMSMLETTKQCEAKLKADFCQDRAKSDKLIRDLEDKVKQLTESLSHLDVESDANGSPSPQADAEKENSSDITMTLVSNQKNIDMERMKRKELEAEMVYLRREFEKDLEKERRRVKSLIESYEKAKGDIESLASRIEKVKEEEEALRQEYTATKKKCDMFEALNANKVEQMKAMTAEMEVILTAEEDENRHLTSKISGLEDALSSLRQQKDSLLAELKAMKRPNGNSELEKQQLNEQIEELVDEIEELKDDLGSLITTNAGLVVDLEEQRRERGKLEQQVVDVTTELLNASSNIKALDMSRRQHNKDIARERLARKEVQKQVEDLKKEKTSLGKKLEEEKRFLEEQVLQFEVEFQRVKTNSNRITEALNRIDEENSRLYQMNMKYESDLSEMYERNAKLSWEKERLEKRIKLAATKGKDAVESDETCVPVRESEKTADHGDCSNIVDKTPKKVRTDFETGELGNGEVPPAPDATTESKEDASEIEGLDRQVETAYEINQSRRDDVHVEAREISGVEDDEEMTNSMDGEDPEVQDIATQD